MKARLPWILLILSVAFNLAFIGGAIYHRHFRPEQPPRPPEEMLGPHWKGLMNETKSAIEPCKREAFLARREFMDALRDPKVSEDSLRVILERSLKRQGQLEERVGLRMIEIRKTLPPEESRRFFERLHKNRPDDERIRRRPPDEHCPPPPEPR